MKILNKIALASLLAFSTTWAFAAADLSGYYSSMHPKTGVALKKAMLHPPTDITIVNASSNYIFAIVPNAINDMINPGFNDHIYNNNPGVWTTYLVLQDPFHNDFFRDNVCREAVITVYGGPGSYRINVDNDLCR